MASRYYNGGRYKPQKRLELQQATKWIVPHLYAAFASSLWERGWTEEQIREIFVETQERWNDSTENGWDILQNVKDVIGIDIMYMTAHEAMKGGAT